jgi:hypothetical protein
VTSSQNDIADVKARLARAESDRDRWRGSGVQEKYLDSMVEALELQLDGLRQAARRSDATSEPLRAAGRGAPGAASERERLMDGVYRLGPYRYDRLADAVEYARRGFRTYFP